MSWGNRKAERVSFTRGFPVHIMGIDGTWQRPCTLLDISETGARLAVEGSLTGLNLKEFFLVLATSGRVSRRCGIIRINGEELGVKFIEEPARSGKKKVAAAK
jgi:hypothetical protein